MKVIRDNVFETNSSSTHAICIVNEATDFEIPDEIEIDLEDYQFGWEFDTRTGYYAKLAYVVIGILNYTDIIVASERINKLLNILKKWVKSVKITGIEIHMYNTDRQHPIYFDTYDGYIDHGSELNEFICILLEDEDLLKRYLFSRDSFIATGNDNSDEKVIHDKEKMSKTHRIFWKGN